MVENRAAAGAARSGRPSRLPADGGVPRLLRRAGAPGPERAAVWQTAAVYHGTWTEARKMFRKSPYLDALPIISVDLSRISAYHLREAHADGQYCTAEVAIALLDLAGDAPAAAALGEHFTRFRTRYLAGKTQHKGSITAGQVENV